MEQHRTLCKTLEAGEGGGGGTPWPSISVPMETSGFGPDAGAGLESLGGLCKRNPDGVFVNQMETLRRNRTDRGSPCVPGVHSGRRARSRDIKYLWMASNSSWGQHQWHAPTASHAKDLQGNGGVGRASVPAHEGWCGGAEPQTANQQS